MSFASLDTSIKGNAEQLANRLKGKAWACMTDMAMPTNKDKESRSRLWVNSIFCHHLAAINKEAVQPSLYFSNDSVQKLINSDIRTVVISDDASYSGKQLRDSINKILKAYKDSGLQPPSIIVNFGFMSQKALQEVNSIIDRGYDIILCPDGREESRVIKNIAGVCTMQDMLIYNNTIAKLMDYHGLASKNAQLEPEKTIAYTEWKTPNDLSLWTVPTNCLYGFEPPYREYPTQFSDYSDQIQN